MKQLRPACVHVCVCAPLFALQSTEQRYTYYIKQNFQVQNSNVTKQYTFVLPARTQPWHW